MRYGSWSPLEAHLRKRKLCSTITIAIKWFLRPRTTSPDLKPSKIEFNLPRPNYTVNTLAHLLDTYEEDNDFSLIMGEDNLKGFHKWKNYEVILENHDIYVYPRISEGEVDHRFKNHKKIHVVDAPIMEISSTFIRKQHRAGRNIRPMLPDAVWKYMDEMNFYRK